MHTYVCVCVCVCVYVYIYMCGEFFFLSPVDFVRLPTDKEMICL